MTQASSNRPQGLNALVCGRGAPTIPLSVGFIFGLLRAGVPLDSIGGPSGGSLAPLLWKCGMPPEKLAVLAARYKSKDLLTSHFALRNKPWQARLVLLAQEIWRRLDGRLEPAPMFVGAQDISLSSISFGKQRASLKVRLLLLSEAIWRRAYEFMPRAPAAPPGKEISLLTILFGNEKLSLMLAEIMQRVYEKTLPTTALYGTDKFGEFFARQVERMLGSPNKLPAGYWTMCIAAGNNGTRQKVVFAADRVDLERIRKNEKEEIRYDKIAAKLPTVRQILQGTIGIPGILDHVQMELEGRIYLMFDGVVSVDERHCPISPITKVLGKPIESIIVFDVGEGRRNLLHPITSLRGWLQDKAYFLACRSCYVGETRLNDDAAGIVIQPRDCGLSYLSLQTGELPKLLAILEGCRATLAGLAKAGRCDLTHVRWIEGVVKEAKRIRRRKQLKRLFLLRGKGEATLEIKKLMALQGLFDLNA